MERRSSSRLSRNLAVVVICMLGSVFGFFMYMLYVPRRDLSATPTTSEQCPICPKRCHIPEEVFRYSEPAVSAVSKHGLPEGVVVAKPKWAFPAPEEDLPDMYGTIPCDDVCPGSRGRCFFGKCLCKPGYFGPRCVYRRPISIVKTFECPNARDPTHDLEQTSECPEGVWGPMTGGPLESLRNRIPRDDWCNWMCHESEGGMVDLIDPERWAFAAKNELEVWEGSPSSTDRNRAHARAFLNYRMVPTDLGDLIEVGCGPFTQTQTLLAKGKKPTSITLTDPNLDKYVDLVPGCTYKTGKLKGHNDGPVPVSLKSVMGEKLLDVFGYNAFDTVVMINVIEHSFSPLGILEAIYGILKPGGLLIFKEKVYPEPMSSLMHEEIVRHPMRIQAHVYDHFFKVLFDFLMIRVAPEWTFIGHKRAVPVQRVV